MTPLQTSTLETPAEQGLRKLIEGNQRFLQGEARFPTVCKETLADLAKGQQPFATILGCSDSRVPPRTDFRREFWRVVHCACRRKRDLTRGNG
jgi:carbonic anhydrase